MPFIPVPTCAQITVRMTRELQLIESVWYYKQDSNLSLTDLEDVATAVMQEYRDNIAPDTMPTNIGLTSVVARDISSEDGAQVEVPFNSGSTGGLGTTSMPNNVSLAVHKDAGISGRHAKARVYHPGLTVGQMDGPNTVGATQVGNIIAAYEGLRSAVGSLPNSGSSLGYVIKRNNGAWLTTGQFVPISGFSVRDRTVDSQRRRLPGRGR